jgi:flagellar hook-associated protein 2
VQSRLNGSTTLSSKSVSVSVSQTAGVLSLTSNQYGSASKIVFEGGTATDTLFGTSPTLSDGVDVAGSLGGNIATGSGQTLKASNGLAVSVLGGATGDRGSITFTRGIAVQLDNLLSKALGDKGSIASSTHALEAQTKDMDAQKVRINSTLAEKEKRYLSQFNSLDSMISNTQSTMAYLTQQLNALNNK